jgi:hypothetical protein
MAVGGRNPGPTAVRRLATSLLAALGAMASVVAVAPADVSADNVLAVRFTTAPAPWPCSSCVVDFSGTASGTMGSSPTFTAVSGAVSGSLTYHDPGCPPLMATGQGTLTAAMMDGSAPATLQASFTFFRDGPFVHVTDVSGTLTDNDGQHSEGISAFGYGGFTTNATVKQQLPPCSPLGKPNLTFTLVLV